MPSKCERTLVELTAKRGIHRAMIDPWKRQAIEGLASTFSGKAETVQANSEAQRSRLHAKIGQLMVEREFFGEGLRSMSVERRREKIDQKHNRCRLFNSARWRRSAGLDTTIGHQARARVHLR